MPQVAFEPTAPVSEWRRTTPKAVTTLISQDKTGLSEDTMLNVLIGGCVQIEQAEHKNQRSGKQQ